MKYTIKIVLECDGEIEEQWALGCVLSDYAPEAEKQFAKHELFLAVRAKAEELLDIDLPSILKAIE